MNRNLGCQFARRRAAAAASWARRGRARSPRGVLLPVAVAVIAAGLLMLAARPVVYAQNAAQAPKSDSTPSGDVQSGKKLYTSYGCYECHGRAAHGGTGPRLGPNPLTFVAFAAYVRHPAGTMPPYTAKVATDQDLADIYAFVASLPASPKAKDVPLLNP